ncbi:Ribonuclease T2-like [Trema orientale]|uniref:Ribonuclease T2-like n=1 Tax=Trema orientale TaxID=63057 RepID=A0A2P5AZ98_TREOI|nr:Ribonuclease T2-like [Trema orientale]
MALLLTILTMASLCSGLGIMEARIVQVEEPRVFGYFVLALLWPPTNCLHTRHCCSSNACCRGSNAPTEFTIRKRFDEKEISTLLDALEKYWPSFSCSSSTNCHGEKHGTCSSPVIWDEYSYFLTTLNVYFKYNVTRVLYEEGYVPSNTEKYPLGGIISAIQNAFHATPLLVCTNGAVEELRLCFYKDFKPRDCVIESTQNDRVSSTSSCPNYVSLPAYMSWGK